VEIWFFARKILRFQSGPAVAGGCTTHQFPFSVHGYAYVGLNGHQGAFKALFTWIYLAKRVFNVPEAPKGTIFFLSANQILRFIFPRYNKTRNENFVDKTGFWGSESSFWRGNDQNYGLS
jgi:hypothetical protein